MTMLLFYLYDRNPHRLSHFIFLSLPYSVIKYIRFGKKTLLRDGLLEVNSSHSTKGTCVKSHVHAYSKNTESEAQPGRS